MSGMNEYNKGYKSGYGSAPPRIPRTFVESVGHDAGRAQREREQSVRQSANSGGAAPGINPVVLRFLLIFAALLVLGMIMVLVGPALIKLFYPAVAIVGLIMTPRVKRALGPVTPVYIGALVGMLLGCFDLAITSAKLNLYNLWIFIFVGGMLGCIGIPIALLRKKK